MKYNLIWHGTKPNGTQSEPYLMSTHDSLREASLKREKIEKIHAEYSDAYRKAFGTGYMQIVPVHPNNPKGE